MSNQIKNDPAVKNTVIKLHIQEGRTSKSLYDEYNITKHMFYKWLKEYREECLINPELKKQSDTYEEIARLNRKIAKQQKEIEF